MPPRTKGTVAQKNAADAAKHSRNSLVDGGRRCTVLPELEDVDTLLAVAHRGHRPPGKKGGFKGDGDADDEREISLNYRGLGAAAQLPQVAPQPVTSPKSSITRKSTSGDLSARGAWALAAANLDTIRRFASDQAKSVERMNKGLSPQKVASVESNDEDDCVTDQVKKLTQLPPKLDNKPKLKDKVKNVMNLSRASKMFAGELNSSQTESSSSQLQTPRSDSGKDYKQLFRNLSYDNRPPSQRQGSRTSRPAKGYGAMNLQPLPIMPESAVQSLFEDEKRREEEVAAMRNTHHGGSSFPSFPQTGPRRKTVTVHEAEDAKGSTDPDAALGRLAGETTRGSGARGTFARSMSFINDNANGVAKHLSEQRSAMKKRGSAFEVVRPTQKISINRKAACDALRLFVFGHVGNEHIDEKTHPKEKDATYYETRGTTEQVETLGSLWTSLDKDGNGWCDISEFREFLQQKGLTKQQREWGERTVSLLLGKKSSFCIEDMMRILWPCAPVEKLLEMTGIVEDAKEKEQTYIPPPVVIPSDDREALKHIFRHLDEEDKGRVTFQMLADGGLIDKTALSRYIDEWDPVFNSDGTLGIEDFITMLCPVGYRAAEDARVACDAEGNIIYLDGKMWKRKHADSDQYSVDDEEDNDDFDDEIDLY